MSIRPRMRPPIVGAHFFTVEAGTFPRPGTSTVFAARVFRAFFAAERGTDRRAVFPPNREVSFFSVEAPRANFRTSLRSMAPFVSSSMPGESTTDADSSATGHGGARERIAREPTLW